MKPTAASVDEYIDQFSTDIQNALAQLRTTIRAVAPEAEETISYGMPAYKWHGSLVYFGVTNTHIGFYPTSTGIAAFADRLTAYDCSKGTVRFPFGQPLPLELIAEIVRFKLEENCTKALTKQKKAT